MPESGESLIYNHPWAQEDEQYNNDHLEKGTYGFTGGFWETRRLHQFCLLRVTGRFKTRNFHQVGAIVSDTPRLGLTTFMSQQGNTLSCGANLLTITWKKLCTFAITFFITLISYSPELPCPRCRQYLLGEETFVECKVGELCLASKH